MPVRIGPSTPLRDPHAQDWMSPTGQGNGGVCCIDRGGSRAVGPSAVYTPVSGCQALLAGRREEAPARGGLAGEAPHEACKSGRAL